MRTPPAFLPSSALQPLTRADLPLGLLCAAALAAPFVVLDQGGDMRTAIVAACVVLGSPGAAIEAMVGVVRLALRVERG
jgi:hypothetical protein